MTVIETQTVKKDPRLQKIIDRLFKGVLKKEKEEKEKEKEEDEDEEDEDEDEEDEENE